MSATADQGGRAALEALVADLDYPMFVVTAAAGGERSGCLVGFVTQCSIDPARLLVCISEQNHTHRVARATSVLVVHFLGSDQLALARLFGEETGDEVDKFASCDWAEGPAGVPVVAGCRGWVAGAVRQQLDLGDHTGFLLDLVAGEAPAAGQGPLGYRELPPLTAGHDA